MLVRCLCVVMALAVTGCAEVTDDGAAPEASTAPTTTVASSTTTTAPSTTTSTSTPAPSSTEPSMQSLLDEPGCETLYDATTDGAGPWFVVNDGVMGGLSAGNLAPVDDAIAFSGEIVTDGGGFSLIRAALLPQSLVDVDRIVVAARADDRGYLLTVADRAPGRDPRTTFQAPIPFAVTSEIQTAAVALDDMQPVVFGRPVDEQPLDPGLAVEIAIQLSDGRDGAFRLELAGLAVCSDPET